MRKSKLFAKIIFTSFLFSIFLCSCTSKKAPKIELGDNFFYWESDAKANYGDAMKNMENFKKLTDKSVFNLTRTLGRGSHYVWIRSEFEIPPYFKNQPLGLVVPELSFAVQLYCNGAFISQYGDFPPNEKSTLYRAHFFNFPLNILNQEGKNIILMRIYVQGFSGISSHSFVQPTQYSYLTFEGINFHHTRIYIFFIGMLIFAFVLYLSFYLNLRNFKEFRDFAIVNIFTSFFITYFFATELPLYTAGIIPFFTFVKLTFYIPSYFIIYYVTLFAFNYMHIKIPKWLKITRISIISLQGLATIFTPTYGAFMQIALAVLILLAVQLLLSTFVIIRLINSSEIKRRGLQFLLGISPLIISGTIDIVLRVSDPTESYPFFSIFGWQFSIIIFIIMLSIRFAKIHRSNEQLSKNLREEVAIRTRELENANNELSLLNEQLEKDKHRSDLDLEMASLVQRNFFPQPKKHFKGWEIAVCYSPQAKVSGDLYDYYSFNNILNGISLFDVSGHGLSASLVTMLSKNIIARLFQTGFRRKEPVDRILTKINNMIIAEKGDIDNYMTGILCSFDSSEDGEQCNVDLGNAGHPYPLKFSLRDKEIFELRGNDGEKHYGAIGMNGINVSFAHSTFVMQQGDILVLYTDGITEAANSKYEQFGIEPLKQIIKQNYNESSDKIVELIIEKLQAFTDGKPLDDDVTLIIAKRTSETDFIEDDEHEEDTEIIEELEGE